MKVSAKTICNQDEGGSTAFIFDLRNSTNVTSVMSTLQCRKKCDIFSS